MQVGESSKINSGPNEAHLPSEYAPISRKLSSVFKTSNASELSLGILHFLLLRAQIFLFSGTFTTTAPHGSHDLQKLVPPQTCIKDQGPDIGHLDCFCFFIVPSGYDHFLTGKSFRLPLIIQLVNSFSPRVVEHELCAGQLDAREGAAGLRGIFLALGPPGVVSFFRTEAIHDLTGEDFVVSNGNPGSFLAGEAHR